MAQFFEQRSFSSEIVGLFSFRSLNVWYIKGLTYYRADKQDFDVLSEGPSSGIGGGAFAQNVEILFIALVVSWVFDTFAAYYPLPTLTTVLHHGLQPTFEKA